MKKIAFFALVAMILVSCGKQTANTSENDGEGGEFTLTMNLGIIVENGYSIDSVRIALDGDNYIASTTEVSEDGVVVLNGTIDEPTLASAAVYLSTSDGNSDMTGTNLLLEKGDLTYSIETDCCTGAPLNDAYNEFYTKLVDELQSGNEDFDISNHVKNYIAKHQNDITSVMVLNNYIIQSAVDPNTLLECLQQTSDKIKAMPQMEELAQKIDLKSASAEGKPFVDFECEYNGQVQHLSDYVGQGKYVLVDFWASWCGPCKAEIPNLINVYNTYAGEKLEVLGVATWDEPEATLDAIKQLGIPYPQIMNAQQAGSDAYSIDGIPEIILFGPDGTILKRGLRGEDIEKAVKEALAL